jgi:hypothetical protein
MAFLWLAKKTGLLRQRPCQLPQAIVSQQDRDLRTDLPRPPDADKPGHFYNCPAKTGRRLTTASSPCGKAFSIVRRPAEALAGAALACPPAHAKSGGTPLADEEGPG